MQLRTGFAYIYAVNIQLLFIIFAIPISFFSALMIFKQVFGISGASKWQQIGSSFV